MISFTDRVKRKIRREISTFELFIRKNRENRRDPNFRLDLVGQGFKDNRGSKVNTNRDFIERIVRSYNLAKEKQKGLDARFQVGDEWVDIYKRHMGKITDALAAGNIALVSSIYENFFRESCSVGLHGIGGDMTARYFGGRIGLKDKMLYVFDFLHRYRMWRNLLGDKFTTADLQTPMIGNPYGYFIDRQFIRAGVDYMHYYATQIGRLLQEEKDRKVVMEIGGGFGGMADFLVRNAPGLTYVDVDLPENMALTAFYLLHALPGKKVLLYGEGDVNSKTIKEYDIILLPNFEIVNLPDHSVNLVFNSYSLAEMSPETIHLYVGEVMRTTKDYFFHVNHNKTSTVVADNFNVDLDKFYLMYKIPCLWNMGRNLSMDEFEYLYKRFN